MLPPLLPPTDGTLVRLKGQGSNTGLLLLGIVIIVTVPALAYFLFIAPR